MAYNRYAEREIPHDAQLTQNADGSITYERDGEVWFCEIGAALELLRERGELPEDETWTNERFGEGR